MKILGRDPAVWLGLVAVIVQALVAWGVDLTKDQQGYINAAATALMGLILAVTVSHEQVVAAAGGLLGAVLQLAVAFGAHISQDQIATAGAVVTAVLAAWLRTQVTAPVAADGTKVPKATVFSRQV